MIAAAGSAVVIVSAALPPRPLQAQSSRFAEGAAF